MKTIIISGEDKVVKAVQHMLIFDKRLTVKDEDGNVIQKPKPAAIQQVEEEEQIIDWEDLTAGDENEESLVFNSVETSEGGKKKKSKKNNA